MNQDAQVMEREPKAIEQQIEGTLSAMSRKVEALERGVRGTARDVAATVTDTYEGVKDAVNNSARAATEPVDGTLKSVQHTVDLKRQVDKHPWWALLGGTVLVGYVLGSLVVRYRRHRREDAARNKEGVHPGKLPVLP